MTMRIRIVAAVLAALVSAGRPASQRAPQQPQTSTPRVVELAQLLRQAPENPGVLLRYAKALAAAGRPNEAVRALDEAIDLGLDPGDEDLRPFQASKGVRGITALLRKAAAARQVVSTSRVAFRVAERDLIPEGVAYDPSDGVFFISSVHKRMIVRVAPGAAAERFSGPDDGLWAVLGMKVRSDGAFRVGSLDAHRMTGAPGRRHDTRAGRLTLPRGPTCSVRRWPTSSALARGWLRSRLPSEPPRKPARARTSPW
jgi:hypothetical protein